MLGRTLVHVLLTISKQTENLGRKTLISTAWDNLMATGNAPARSGEQSNDQVIVASALDPLAGILSDDQLTNIIVTCAADAINRIKMMGDELKEANYDQIQAYAHDVKSTSGQIGALKIQEKALILEQACKDNTVGIIPGLIFQLQDEALRLVEATTSAQIKDVLSRLTRA